MSDYLLVVRAWGKAQPLLNFVIPNCPTLPIKIRSLMVKLYDEPGNVYHPQSIVKFELIVDGAGDYFRNWMREIAEACRAGKTVTSYKQDIYIDVSGIRYNFIGSWPSEWSVESKGLNELSTIDFSVDYLDSVEL